MIITQVVIAAGGRGERLRPKTDTLPKVMIPIGGKPLLEHTVDHFKKHGAKEFFLTIRHLPERVMGYFGDGARWGVKISYHVENEPLGDMGGVKAFEGKLNDEFFFVWGDMYTAVNYTKMAERFGQFPNAVGMERVAKTEYNPEADYVGLDETMRMVAVYPKGAAPPGRPVYRLRGSIIYRKRVLSCIPAGAPFFKKSLLLKLLEAGEAMYGWECDEYSRAIDTVEKWREVEEYVKRSNPA